MAYKMGWKPTYRCLGSACSLRI